MHIDARKLDPDSRKLIEDQLHAAHVYYNKLIELERWRIEQFREIRGRHVPGYNEAEARMEEVREAIEQARAEIQRQRQGARKRLKMPPELKERLDALKAERKALGATLKQMRETFGTPIKEANTALKQAVKERVGDGAGPRIIEKVRPEIRAEMLADERWAAAWRETTGLDAETLDKQKELRSKCGCSPGTYQLTERAADQAKGGGKKKKGESSKPKRRGPPRFRRWDGGGVVGVQLHDVSIGAVYGQLSNMLQIDPLPPSQWSTPSGRRHAYTVARVRLGSDGRAPVWASLPVLMHRAVPRDAVVTWAAIVVTKDGHRMRHELQLTVETNELRNKTERCGTVAIDLGWRTRPDGIRVGYAVDDTGREVELKVPASVADDIRYSERLQGHADRTFDTARAALRSLLAAGEPSIPAWVAEQCTHLQAWRSHNKLERLTVRWLRELSDDEQKELLGALSERAQKLRASGGDEWVTFEQFAAEGWPQERLVLAYLLLWRRRERHLGQWRTDQRRKAQNRRRDVYRCFAADVARRYERVVLEAFNLEAFATNAEPEDEKEDNERRLHRVRALAAPSTLVDALRNACGSTVVFVEPRNTTRECHRCGHVNEWKDQSILVQVCAGCGASWDQDANAARVMLGRLPERSGTEQDPGGARSGGQDATTEPSNGALAANEHHGKPSRSQTASQGNGIAAE